MVHGSLCITVLRGDSRRVAFPSALSGCCDARDGYTMIELLVAMSMLGIVAAIALRQYRAGQVQINAAQQLVIATLRGARASAITKSVHLAVEFPSSSQLVLERLQEVDAVWQVDTSDVRTIPPPPVTQLADTAIGTRVEFNSRGEAVNLTGPRSDAHLYVEDNQGATVPVVQRITTVQVSAKGDVYRGRKDANTCAGTVTVGMLRNVVPPSYVQQVLFSQDLR